MHDEDQHNILIAAPVDHANSNVLTVPTAVTFRIERWESSSKGVSGWLGMYKSEGLTASFLFELDEPYAKDDSTVPPMLFGEGRFSAVETSDSTAMVAALARVLEASSVPKSLERAALLPFTYVSFGDELSPAPRGGFQTKPVGDWTLMKLFLGENTEEDEGQVFLALNPLVSKGQFAMKDPDYGDTVLRHLASVL